MFYDTIRGLKEEDFMTLRWNADIHTIRRKTGEYRIINNQGACLGEIRKEADEKYKISFYGDEEFSKEISRIKKVAEKAIYGQLKSPAYKSREITFSSPYLSHYQKNSFRFAA